MAAAVGGDLPGLHEDHAEALDEDDCLDEVGGLEIGAGEARHTTGLTRVIQLANDDQRDDADHRAEAEDLVDEVVDRGATDERPVELGSKVCPYASNQTMAPRRKPTMTSQ